MEFRSVRRPFGLGVLGRWMLGLVVGLGFVVVALVGVVPASDGALATAAPLAETRFTGGIALFGLLGLAVGSEPDSAISDLADAVEGFDPREDEPDFSVDRDDEVGRLADALEEMAGRMRRHEYELEASERYRQELYRITSASDLTGEEKIGRLLELGCERLGLDSGLVSRIDEETGHYEVQTACRGDVTEGQVTDLSSTFCRLTIESEDILGVYDADAEGYDDPTAAELDVDCYIGGKIEVDDELYGTVCFLDPDPRAEPFSHTEKTFVDLVSRWVSHVLERRKRERELHVKDRAMDAAPIGITITDPDREDNPMVYVNEGFERLTGYDADDCLGRNCRFLQGEGTSEDRVDELREAIAAAEPVTTELRNYREDGTEFWNRLTVAPVTENGEVVNFVGFQEDVTERKERERELQERERELSTLIENVPGMVYRCANEPDWPFEFVSEGCRAVTGYDPEDLESGAVNWNEDVIVSDNQDLWESVQESVENREPFTVTYAIEDADGERRWLWEQGRGVFEDGDLVALEGVIQDVTERKERERKLDALVENTENPIYIKDCEGVYTFVNEAAADVFERDRSEVVGKTDHDLFGEETAAEIRADDERIMTSGDSIVTEGVRYIDGERHVFLDNKYPYRDADGEIIGIMGISRDVTERKEREREARRNERRFEAVFEDPEMLVGLLDADGTFRRANDTAMSYVDAEQADVVGKPFWETAWWADEEDAEDILREKIERAAAGEYVRYTADHMEAGTESYSVEGTIRPVRADGEIESLILSSRDVTERKERARELRETKERLRTIIDASPVAIIASDADGEVTQWNPTAEDIFGWSESEAVGKHLPIVPENRQDEHERLRERLRDGETITDFETKRQRKDGTLIDVNLALAPLADDGDLTGMLAVVQDITERKEREQELERTREMLEQSQRLARVGAWEVEATGDESALVTMTDQVYRIHGLPPETDLTLDEALDFYHPDDRDDVERAIERAMDEARPFEFEARLVTAAHTVRWVRSRGEPITEDGEVVSVRGSIQDITESKEYERELRDRDKRLREHNRTLQRLAEISADRDRSFEEKVEALLDLGRERLDIASGFLSEIEVDEGQFEIVTGRGSDERLSAGAEAPLSETYCRRMLESGGLLAIADASAEGWPDDPAYERWGYESYIGGKIEVEGELVGTLSFVDRSSHASFTDLEQTFVELAARWVSYELERERREERLARYKEYTDDILDAVDDVFYVLGADGSVQRWNEGLSEVTGYSHEEIADMHALDFFDDEETEIMAAAIEDVIETGDTVVEAPFLTKGGEEIPYEYVASRLEDPDGNTVIVGIGRDITERVARERELERTKELLQQAQRMADVGGWELDLRTEPYEMTWTDQLYRLYELPVGTDVTMETAMELMHPDDRPVVSEIVQQVVETGESYDMETRLFTTGGEERWTRAVGEPVYEDGDIVAIRGSVQDITPLKERELALQSLHEATRGLLGTESEQEVADLVVEAAADVFDTPSVAVYLLDTDAGQLVPAAHTQEFAELCDGAPTVQAGDSDSLLWNCFVAGTRTVVGGSDATSGSELFGPGVPGGLVVPMGDHGAFVLTVPGEEVDDETRQLVETLVATTEAAFDRLESEASLRAREAELEAQNSRLRRQMQINDIIRSIHQSLVGAGSREEIERTVCDRLVESEDIAFAWIGEPDPAESALQVRTWAGRNQAYLDSVSLSLDTASPDPAVVTAREETPTVVGNVIDDMQAETWRQRALANDFQSVVSVPLTLGEYSYGVLTVYANDAGTFGDLERTVFAELGESIANSISAVQTRRALHAETLTELTLHLAGSDAFLGRVASEADCEVEFEGLGAHDADEARLFFTTDGDADAVATVLDDLVSVLDYRLVSDAEDGSLFEATVTGDVLAARLVRHGGSPQSITVTDDGLEVVVDVPTTTDVREFVEMLGTDAELVSRRDVERSMLTRQELVSSLLAQLTERQREVLRTAYFAGYFDWPRKSTGEAVAEMLGVTQPTVNRHLRLGQRTVLSQLFENTAVGE